MTAIKEFSEKSRYTIYMGEKVLKTKPAAYDYLDIVDYLKDMFDFLAEEESKFTFRKFAMKSGVDQALVSRILKRHSTLTEQTLVKVLGQFKVNREEFRYLICLRELSESKTQKERVAAFGKMIKNKNFRESNKENLVGHEFLSKWYYPAIHELAKLPDFQCQPKWIRERFNKRLTTGEINEALDFLFEHGYLIREGDKVRVGTNEITCAGGIYRLAASEYHGTLLQIAQDSIHEVDRDYRQILAQTVAMPESMVGEVCEVLREAVQKIGDMNNKEEDKDSVYQISMLAFPLTSRKRGEA